MSSVLDNKDVKALCKAFASLENEREARAFLRDLLTEGEMLEFGRRWKAAQMLNDNLSYRDIEAETGLSSTTIARISKWLQGGTGGYRKMLDKQFPSGASPRHH
ncbi:MAG: hypothetical protein KDD66_08480 [Bdellovibrionales bacterium]|nr:hypothetical protein [Bdellovibrionales bacterium]